VYNTTANATQPPDGNSPNTSGHILLTNSKSGTSRYSMAIGLDQANGFGYLNAAGNGAFQPICLNTRGGNVGIGVTNPGATLTIGNTLAGFGFSMVYSSTLSSAGSLSFQPTKAGIYISSYAGDVLIFSTTYLYGNTSYSSTISYLNAATLGSNAGLGQLSLSSAANGAITATYKATGDMFRVFMMAFN
jgi:hypothetical protein